MKNKIKENKNKKQKQKNKNKKKKRNKIKSHSTLLAISFGSIFPWALLPFSAAINWK